jgi:hypothetical protein
MSKDVQWAFVTGPAQLWDLIAAVAGPGSASKREFLVKVNWFGPPPGNYTGPAALDMLLRALPGPATVIESHSSGRTDGSRWIPAGEAVGENRDWLRGQERAFLQQAGLQAVLDRHRAPYLNVTEEAWAGRTVDPALVRRAVEERGPGRGPISHQELLGFVPSALHERRERALFIDFARLKLTDPDAGHGFSLGLKNMFGLIPEPDRSPYHHDLPRTILDVNRIYHALFDVVTVCEALENVAVYRPGGAQTAPGGTYDTIAMHPGLVVAGRNPLAVDAAAGTLFGVDLAGRALCAEAATAFAPPSAAMIAGAQEFGRGNGLSLR